jgi:hypothetical protein
VSLLLNNMTYIQNKHRFRSFKLTFADWLKFSLIEKCTYESISGLIYLFFLGMPLIPAASAVVVSQSALGHRGDGYSSFSLCVIHKEGLNSCPYPYPIVWGRYNMFFIML